jgi:CopG family transcriptional regulator / antitoxin EndoAI
MSTDTSKRVNISLPAATLAKIDGLTEKGDRSKFIDTAVHYYVEAVGKKQLVEALKEGAIRHAARDSSIAGEWFLVDESVWKGNE